MTRDFAGGLGPVQYLVCKKRDRFFNFQTQTTSVGLYEVSVSLQSRRDRLFYLLLFLIV